MSRWSRVIRLGDYFNEEQFEVKELESYEHFINRLNKILTLKYEQVGKKSSLGFVTCEKWFDNTKFILQEFYKQSKVIEVNLPKEYTSPFDVLEDCILASDYHDAYNKGMSCVVSIMEKFVGQDFNYFKDYKLQESKEAIEIQKVNRILKKIEVLSSKINALCFISNVEVLYDKKEREITIDIPMEVVGFEALDNREFSLVFGEGNFNPRTWEYVKNDKLPFIYSYIEKQMKQSELEGIKVLIASKDYDRNLLFLMENGVFTKGSLIE